MKDPKQEARGLHAARSAEECDPTGQIVDGDIYEKGEEPTTFDAAKVIRRLVVVIVTTSILVGLLLLLAGVWIFGPDLGLTPAEPPPRSR